MTTTEPDIAALQTRLDARAVTRTKQWWERYLKGAIAFRGVKMADIRATVHAWAEAQQLAALSDERRVATALALLREPLAEDKLAGILLLQERLLPADAVVATRFLPAAAALFDDGHVADWNTCDWLCVKVLGPLIARSATDAARRVAGWREAANLWRARASAVAFVPLLGHRDAPPSAERRARVLASCGALAGRDERFAQTGAGWVLRELWKTHPDQVVAWLEVYGRALSAEGMRYATEKMARDEQLRLRALRRSTSRG